MLGIGKYIKQYFELSKSEFRGFVAFFCLIFLCLILFSLWPDTKHQAVSVQVLEQLINVNSTEPDLDKFFTFNPNTISADSLNLLGLPQKAIQSLLRYRQAGGFIKDTSAWMRLYNLPPNWGRALIPFLQLPIKQTKKFNQKQKPITPKLFNPNQISAITLESFGTPKFIAQRWENYLNKGGKFKQATDIYKLYGMDSAVAAALIPYAKFESIDTISSTKATKIRQVVELNTADSLALLSVPGIGPAFASRIIKLRTNLGGFVRIEQLLEVYGFDQEKFEQVRNYLALNEQLIDYLNINNSDIEKLGRHPYIGFKSAKILINYRLQHGAFKSIEDLTRSKAFDSPDKLERLKPYIQF